MQLRLRALAVGPGVRQRQCRGGVEGQGGAEEGASSVVEATEWQVGYVTLQQSSQGGGEAFVGGAGGSGGRFSHDKVAGCRWLWRLSGDGRGS